MTRLSPAFTKRGRYTILYEILTILQTGPAKKTHRMYRANLSHVPLRKFLTVLLAKGFCTEVRQNGSTAYHITAKGQRFMHAYQQLQALFDT